MADVKNLHERELIGTLTRLSNGDTVSVEHMRFDKQSEQKLLKVLNEKRVTGRDVQDLFIRELCIKAEDADKFRKDQSAWIREGNNYSLTSKPVNRPHFKGDMQGLTRISGVDKVVEAKIGNIEFDISEQYGTVSGDVVIFQNVSATIYPGQYSVRIIED